MIVISFSRTDGLMGWSWKKPYNSSPRARDVDVDGKNATQTFPPAQPARRLELSVYSTIIGLDRSCREGASRIQKGIEEKI
jgi:hypothetical protein